MIRDINSIQLALDKYNPGTEIRVLGPTWFDPGKEADAANALIDQGVDVIFQHTDSRPHPGRRASWRLLRRLRPDMQHWAQSRADLHRQRLGPAHTKSTSGDGRHLEIEDSGVVWPRTASTCRSAIWCRPMKTETEAIIASIRAVNSTPAPARSRTRSAHRRGRDRQHQGPRLDELLRRRRQG